MHPGVNVATRGSVI